MKARNFYLPHIEYAKGIVLPLLKQLQRLARGKGVKAGIVADHLSLQRRQTYNYLRVLEIAGLAKLDGKRWKAA